MVSRGEDYAFVRPSLVRGKIRKLELLTAPRTTQAQAKPIRVFATPEQHRLEKQLAAQAEVA